jgi:hypothetical protein
MLYGDGRRVRDTAGPSCARRPSADGWPFMSPPGKQGGRGSDPKFGPALPATGTHRRLLRVTSIPLGGPPGSAIKYIALPSQRVSGQRYPLDAFVRSFEDLASAFRGMLVQGRPPSPRAARVSMLVAKAHSPSPILPQKVRGAPPFCTVH